MLELDRFLAEVRAAVDADLEQRLAVPARDPGRLREAMRYAVLGGGKRLRPALVVAGARAAGGDLAGALPAAAAVELLHAYTLVHDDLPAMDDDDLRRGRPTVHIVFGEAIAILAGDGLLTEAFAALAPLAQAGEAVRVLAARAGADELLGGQALDLEAGPDVGFDALEAVHRGKTGALFAASVELGGIAAGAGTDQRAALARIGMALGVAFQHADDLADGDHPALAARARTRAHELVAEVRRDAAAFGSAGDALVAMAGWVESLVPPG